MRNRHGTAVVGAIATLLATLPLSGVFETWTWFFDGLFAVVAVVGAATLARVLRGPAGVQVLAGLAGLVVLLTLLFPSGHGEIAGIIPTRATFTHFNELLRLAGTQIRGEVVPVPDLDGLLLLCTAGIGLMAILVDLAAVGLRRPALAGLPMLALYSVPVAVLPGGLNFLAFAAAGLGYLWLLVNDNIDRVRRFGRRFSGDGRNVEVWAPSALASWGRRLGVAAIVAAIVLPLLVPGVSPSLLNQLTGGPGREGPGGSGGGLAPVDSVDMNALLSDNLTLADTFEMVDVTTNDPNPYYLRLGVGLRLDEDGFHSDLPSAGGVPVDQNLDSSRPPGVVGGESYAAQIQIKHLSSGLAPVYTLLTKVTGLDGYWAFVPDTEEVYSRQRNISQATYSVEYERLAYTADELRGAGPVTDDLALLSVAPPSAQVADLVAGLIDGQTTEYDQVRALYEYFRAANGFSYSFRTEPGNSGSAIVDFLNNKKGFCVQYAAALGWLVREAGYPSRVAFGFTRGIHQSDGSWTMTNRNLHAWTEVYFPDFGWVPFDATPGADVPGSTTNIWEPDNTAGGPPPVERPPAEEPSAAATLPNQHTPGTPNQAAPAGRALHIEPWYVIVAAGVVLLVAILLVPSLQRRARRRRRLAAASDVIALTPQPPGTDEEVVTDPEARAAAQRDAHNAWAELLDLMIDYGVLVDPTETPRATVARLARTPEFSPAGGPATLVLARAEERARYAPAPLRVATLDEAVRQAQRAFAQDATWWQQLSARIFPRSVLLSWRLSWFGLLARVTRRTGRVRDALLLTDLRSRRR